MKLAMALLRALSLLSVVMVPAFALPGAATAAGDPPSLKLYILDCGVLLYNDLRRFGYKPGDIKPTNLSDACYLVVHPTKGTLLWDMGAVPDTMWANDGFAPRSCTLREPSLFKSSLSISATLQTKSLLLPYLMPTGTTWPI